MTKYLLIVISIIAFSCTNSGDKKVVVDFGDPSLSDKETSPEDTRQVYIAIASMTSPKETYIYYNDLIKFISDELGYPIYIKQKKTYEEVNLLLKKSEVDFAFICTGAYVEEIKKENIKLLVGPQIEHKTTYNAYIIAHKNAEIEKFEDFKNKSFAFTDPLSTTGRLFPLEKLEDRNLSEEDFFKKSIYTYGHDISIQMVNRGIIDGASVHGLIYNYLSVHYPEKVENLKIIEKSENYGIPPIVVPASLDKKSYELYQNIFINLHNDSLGREILDRLDIDRFVVLNDSIYKSVFKLKNSVRNVEGN